VVPHPDPIYRIEGEAGRRADGIYDKMGPVGAHEVVVETPDHNKRLSQLSDEEIERVIWVWASRVADLKKDVRLKHVSVYKNQGVLAGEEWPHAHSEVTGTIFVPRRIKYELRASREWYREKERCVFCDIVRQEEKLGKRIVDVQGDYYALCPYAARVPYEIWLLHRRAYGAKHEKQKGRTCRVLEDFARRLPLAHRNPADRGKQEQIVQHQGNLF
jgi:UDPglucose--hexose-1-phosphate uridylyltransferase